MCWGSFQQQYISRAIERAKTSSAPYFRFLTWPCLTCKFQKLSRARGTRYMASSDLRDGGSNKMAKPQVKHATMTFQRSSFCLLFFMKQVRYLNIATKPAKNRLDFMMFTTRFFKVGSGLKTITKNIPYSETIFFLLNKSTGIKWIGKQNLYAFKKMSLNFSHVFHSQLKLWMSLQ